MNKYRDCLQTEVYRFVKSLHLNTCMTCLQEILKVGIVQGRGLLQELVNRGR